MAVDTSWLLKVLAIDSYTHRWLYGCIFYSFWTNCLTWSFSANSWAWQTFVTLNIVTSLSKNSRKRWHALISIIITFVASAHTWWWRVYISKSMGTAQTLIVFASFTISTIDIAAVSLHSRAIIAVVLLIFTYARAWSCCYSSRWVLTSKTVIYSCSRACCAGLMTTSACDSWTCVSINITVITLTLAGRRSDRCIGIHTT